MAVTTTSVSMFSSGSSTMLRLAFALTIFGFMPRQEIFNSVPSLTLRTKRPLTSVTVPDLVPTTIIDAPTNGPPSSSETMPPLI